MSRGARKFHQRGLSVLQVLVLVSLITMTILGAYALLVRNVTQVRALREKIDSLGIEKKLEDLIGVPQYCTCLLAGKTIDVTRNPIKLVGPIGTLPESFGANCIPSSTSFVKVAQEIGSPDMVTKSTILGEISPYQSTTDEFSAKVIVAVDDKPLAIALRELAANVTLKVDINTPANSRTILGCMSGTEWFCLPGSKTSSMCPTIANGTSAATCGVDMKFGSCKSTCNAGYSESGTQPNIVC
ncbi:MAG TPA: hypothetical protein PLU50_00455, partial [Pseudobdellovibrionaceae bacterium]|nr:hypothetical protein [Pseudobdellovibrionaceae bacterium]